VAVPPLKQLCAKLNPGKKMPQGPLTITMFMMA